MKNKSLMFFAIVIFSLASISALTVSNVEIQKIYPGQSSDLRISIKNNLQDDVEDVSLNLNLDNTLFTSVGSSEDSMESIDEGEKETFNFEIKANSNAEIGDYNIPYSIKYSYKNQTYTKTGSFGVSVSAKTELNYNLELENNVFGEKGKISLKIVNSGLGDIGFFNVKIISKSGVEILGQTEEYIGTIRSDDFETSSFNAFFNSLSGSVTFKVNYKDSENNDEEKIITLPVNIYSRETALQMGIIKKRSFFIYLAIPFLVVLWLVWRWWRKSKRKKQEA